MPRAPKTSLPATPPETGGTGKALPLLIVLSGLLLIAVVTAGYFYYQYQKSKPGAAEAKEIEQLQTSIGAMMLLPEGEKPTLATVTDRDKLAEQAFFQKAENGDKVLIYSGAGRAILYRPSLRKIIDVTTVNINTPAAENPAPAAEAPAAPSTEAVPVIVRVALYNGSTTVGATAVVESELKNGFKNIAVIGKENAKKNDYPETIVVDLTGTNSAMAEEMAQSLNGKVGSLPEGETRPESTDILIIVGTN